MSVVVHSGWGVVGIPRQNGWVNPRESFAGVLVVEGGGDCDLLEGGVGRC